MLAGVGPFHLRSSSISSSSLISFWFSLVFFLPNHQTIVKKTDLWVGDLLFTGPIDLFLRWSIFPARFASTLRRLAPSLARSWAGDPILADLIPLYLRWLFPTRVCPYFRRLNSSPAISVSNAPTQLMKSGLSSVLDLPRRDSSQPPSAYCHQSIRLKPMESPPSEWSSALRRSALRRVPPPPEA